MATIAWTAVGSAIVTRSLCIFQHVNIQTIQKNTFLVELVFRAGNKYTLILWNRSLVKFFQILLFNNVVLCRMLWENLETGSMEDAATSGRPNVLSSKTLYNISHKLLANPSKAFRKLSQEMKIRLRIAQTAAKEKLNFFP